MANGEWSIAGRDLDGRKRPVSVVVWGERVVVASAGEYAVLSPLEVGRLRAALRDAALTAAGEEPPRA
ncbi:hypothetical protein [Amycolatopsis anabasis]|uniref:hypothetical protein n=1 Tax=Amycolatopsis anabasis TaxID=1840409 RepID=UPI00131C9DF0|nr:hypothetical protein [Amycolatopsis anabasis]